MRNSRLYSYSSQKHLTANKGIIMTAAAPMKYFKTGFLLLTIAELMALWTFSFTPFSLSVNFIGVCAVFMVWVIGTAVLRCASELVEIKENQQKAEK